jgi:hypothetical protein
MRSVMMCGVLLATAASAADPEVAEALETRKSLVGVAPIALAQGYLSVEGERALSPRLSARLGVRLASGRFRRAVNEGDLWDSEYFTGGVEPGLRYYLTGTVLDGLWVGSHLELSRHWINNENEGTLENQDRQWNAGVAALVGYSMVVTRGLTVQAGLGLGASYTSGQATMLDLTMPDDLRHQKFGSSYWGVSHRATLSVGWAF